MLTSSATGLLRRPIAKIAARPSTIGQRNFNLNVESPGPQECGVQDVGPVCGTEDEDALQVLDPIHLGQELADHSLGDMRVGAAEPRLGTSASISSKKMMQGAACLALWKISRTPRSDSPTYFESRVGPLTEMKLTCVSVARALASSVLPQPGGPESKIPLGGFTSGLA